MAFDFPSSPTVGQIFSVGDAQYSWNGYGWSAKSGAVSDFVFRSGDTMTGPLTLSGDPTADLHAVPKRWAAPFDAMAYSGMQVNGALTVSQETPLGTVIPTPSKSFFCDGWQHAGSASDTTQVTLWGQGLGLVEYKTTGHPSLGASDFFCLYTNIEGHRVARLAWGTAIARPITIHFWSLHQRPGLYAVGVRNEAANRSYVATYTQTVAGVVERQAITIPGDTTGTWNAQNTVGLTVLFTAAAGTTFTAPAANTWYAGHYFNAPGTVNGFAASSDAFRIGAVMILPGTQAPTFEQAPLIMRPFDQELVTCQRYYEKSFSYNVAPAVNQSPSHTTVAESYATGNLRSPWISFLAQKRAAPSLTFYADTNSPAPTSNQWAIYNGVSWVSGSTITAGVINELGYYVGISGTITQHNSYLISGSWSADVRL